MKKLIILILAPLILSGCRGKAIESVTKGEFNIELLFEKDGVKMYRFCDGGHYVYWCDASGKVEYDHQEGKNNSVNEVIITTQ